MPGEWDWHEFCRSWRPQQLLSSLGISAGTVKRHIESLDSSLSFSDPLCEWDDLLPFVRPERRQKLRGSALGAQTLQTMLGMLRLLYKELTGEELHSRQGSLRERFSLNESTPQLLRTNEERARRVTDDAALLEFVSNRYGLNPRPKLVLFVEGPGEERALPLLAERLFGASLPRYGIEVRNLHGLPGFLGKKRKLPYGALEKVIEELHLAQTVVFILLDYDNFPRILDIRKRLSETKSNYQPHRSVTRRELIHVWQSCIEFDNFNDTEIAGALTSISGGRHLFSPDDVARVRPRAGQDRSNPLGKLYKERFDYGLNKIELLTRLCEATEPRDEPGKPIVAVIRQVLTIASRNYGSRWIDTWFHNQEAGLLGHPEGEREPNPDVERLFAPLRELQRHWDDPGD